MDEGDNHRALADGRGHSLRRSAARVPDRIDAGDAGLQEVVAPGGLPGDFAFVDFDGQSVFDLDVVDIDPSRNGAGCYLIVKDVDDWHARMAAAGLPVTPVADQPWSMREFTLTDPSGNHVRIGRPLS